MKAPHPCTFGQALRQPVDQPLHAALAPPAAPLLDEAPSTDEDWADFAKLEFEPWTNACDIPENTEWLRRAEQDVVILRLAWVLMTKTKPELTAMFRDMDNEAATTLTDALLHVRDGYKGLSDMASAAMSRCLCAALCAAQEGER